MTRKDTRLRLAVVDDSMFVRKALTRLLADVPAIEVVGTACSGDELLDHLEAWQPDAVTLDLSMPGLGGLATLERILQWRRIPVIILSTHSTKNAPLTIEALHQGAVDFIDKGEFSLVDFQALRETLVTKLLDLNAAQPDAHPKGAETPRLRIIEPASRERADREPGFGLLAIGASTGGPPAIQRLLEDVGRPLPVPTVVVQHMPAGFTKAFAARLNGHLQMTVKEASNSELLLGGHVYIAPAGSHLRVRVEGQALYSELTGQPDGAAHRPSVDVLFESAVAVARKTVAVLLTGMGADGAQGLLALRRAGALTIAQSESSSVIYGMPRAAAELGAVDEQLHLERIGQRVREAFGVDSASRSKRVS